MNEEEKLEYILEKYTEFNRNICDELKDSWISFWCYVFIWDLNWPQKGILLTQMDDPMGMHIFDIKYKELYCDSVRNMVWEQE